MKKIFLAIFVLSFVAMPAVSNAGFFDFLRGERNQAAQVRTSVSATADSGTYIEGDRNDTIKRIQALLKSKNLYRGSVSGIFGPQTKAAIMAYQKSNGLTVTGALDTETINSILGRGSDGERGGGTTAGPITASANCAPGDMPWIQVTEPNGGETYVPGENVKVQWESCNVPTTDNVFLVFNQWQPTNGASTIGSTGNDGIEQITLPDASNFGTDPTDYTYGANFKISVVWATDTNVRDYTDGLFSIVEDGGGNQDVPLLFTPMGRSEGVYTDAQGNDVGVFNIFFNLKNTSSNIVYIENSCGYSGSGMVMALRNENVPGVNVNPSLTSCFISYFGSGNATHIFLNPNDEFQGVITFTADPVLTPAYYRLYLTSVNYETPSQTSPTVNLSLEPQTHPLAQSWWQLITNALMIDN